MSDPKDETWRWGIIGPGRIAAQFADGMALVDDGVITAVASRSRDRAEAFAARYGIPSAYGDARELFDDADVDVVYVATPHSRHAADTIAALDAGKPVLCEKPLALSARQAAEMVDRARERGLFLMEAMWTRFLPAYVALRDLLAEGRLGEPLVVEADFGFRVQVIPDHRLFDRALGGGATLDLGVYPVQLCSLVLGTPDGVTASGSVGTTGVDELVAAALHHPGGQLGVVKAAIRVSLSCTARISCADGWIDIPAFMHRPSYLVVNGSSGAQRIDAEFDGEGLRFQVHEVHRCLAAGLTESAVMPLDETLQIASTLDAIRAPLGVTYPGE